MRRIVVALIAFFGLLAGASPAAACVDCVKNPEPRPCAGVKRCDWGGDPYAIWVEVRGTSKKQAVARAKKVLTNLKRAEVKPRTADILAFKGGKLVQSRTYRLKGKHWRFSEEDDCWYVR